MEFNKDKYIYFPDKYCSKGGWYEPVCYYSARDGIIVYKCQKCGAQKLVTEHDALKKKGA
jgi:hypothetical protein